MRVPGEGDQKASLIVIEDRTGGVQGVQALAEPPPDGASRREIVRRDGDIIKLWMRLAACDARADLAIDGARNGAYIIDIGAVDTGCDATGVTVAVALTFDTAPASSEIVIRRSTSDETTWTLTYGAEGRESPVAILDPGRVLSGVGTVREPRDPAPGEVAALRISGREVWITWRAEACEVPDQLIVSMPNATTLVVEVRLLPPEPGNCDGSVQTLGASLQLPALPMRIAPVVIHAR